MLTLALASLYAARLHQSHIGTDGEHALEFVGEFLLHCKHAAYIVAEEVLADLHLHLQSIEIIDTVNYEHILRLKLLHIKYDALDL